ncbi:MAG TPA: GH92 family glycosyl hydrolase [Terracidiphilus sp.]|nr:GH92 family glycosyl hydrolase [Terracidiphilus sp.]
MLCLLVSREFVFGLVLCSFSAPTFAAQSQASAYDLVDTRIGTAGGGNTFPGASLPFGMVQWSPDTNHDGWYRYDEKSILGFSLTHISGAGCPLYGDFGVLPVTGELTTSPGKDLAPYAAAFDHAHEETHPGYYAVTLASGVKVEITVTARSGIARFTFPSGVPARLLVNAGSSTESIPGGSTDFNHDGISLAGTDGFTASSRAGHFCQSDSHYKIFATGRFNKPFSKTAMWQDDAVMAGGNRAEGRRTGAWLDFGNEREVVLKIGISFVSEDGAGANLASEVAGWDFDEVRAKAKSAWTELLERFAVEGGTDDQRKIFYTGVYHSFLSPNLFSDIDGRYMGFDGKVHTVSGRQKAQYANFSDWDIYRNTVQLQALFEPERASDMMQSLVNDAAQGGQLPRWEAANDVTYVMGGDSPAPVIASSYAFGARNFDAEAALKYMVKAATETKDNRERPYLADYLKLGYVPSDKDEISVSRTLEYTSDDFAIAQFAKALGHDDIAGRFLKQSENWKNLVDPQTHWLRPRNSDGSWLEGFDPDHAMPKRRNSPVAGDQRGFEEGNTWQYSFMIPYDYPDLFAAMGGDDTVVPRLDKFFVKLRCWGEPCYNIENEPDFVVPYAYVWAGQPWKTQEVVTRIARDTFKASPDGIPGNDDLGATSGVYIWDALGMYPAVPGVGGVVLGTPMFTKATLRLADGRTLVISRSGDGIYVSNVAANGEPLASNWLPVAKIHAGENQLHFSMQASPDAHRGTAAADRPPALR